MSKSKFIDAFENTLKWEDPSGRGVVTTDSGGLTKWGISKKAYPDDDIANLSREDAMSIYQADYWNPLYYDIDNQNVANKLFDMGVNMGVRTAVKLTQKALHGLSELVGIDGKFGPTTLAAINRVSSQNLLTEMRAECCQYYSDLVGKDPKKYERYINGWLKRGRS